MERFFKNIENSARGTESERASKDLFDDIDVNSNQLGGIVTKRNELLVKILNAIGGLKLDNFQENTIDAFGDSYEYLMTMYDDNAGKSSGAEWRILKYLIDNNYIDTVIQLSPDPFFWHRHRSLYYCSKKKIIKLYLLMLLSNLRAETIKIN